MTAKKLYEITVKHKVENPSVEGTVVLIANDGMMFAEVKQVDAVEVEKYNALIEMYHNLRENFIDYVCSGVPNVAPYCLNICEGCTDGIGWCRDNSDKCKGFNPAEVILDGERKDNDQL